MENPKKQMQRMTVGFGILTLLFFLLDVYLPWGGWFSLFMTAATTFYHFSIRLLVGAVMRSYFGGRINGESRWFAPRRWEKSFYEAIGIKKWKNRMPTYFPQDFSFKEHTPAEVAQAMCISEVGHEINVICSFLPLLYALFQPRLQEDWYIFALTGILALGADLPFIWMQRYNRPRVMAMQATWEKRQKREAKKDAVEL